MGWWSKRKAQERQRAQKVIKSELLGLEKLKEAVTKLEDFKKRGRHAEQTIDTKVDAKETEAKDGGPKDQNELARRQRGLAKNDVRPETNSGERRRIAK